MSTEQDLRVALRSLVPDDLDATDFRARIDRTGETDGRAIDPDGVEPIYPPRRHWRARTGLLLTAAAVVAGVVAIALATLPGGGTDQRPADPPPTSTATAPAAIRPLLLPGTIVLHTYTGRGRGSFDVTPLAVPPHFEYDAYFTCRGGGALRIGDGAYSGTCGHSGSAAGGSNPLVRGKLIIRPALPTTTWRVTLALAPRTRTNGSLQSPVDADLSGPDDEVRQSGTGSATVSLRGARVGEQPGTRYRVRLVCRGSGVGLPDLRGRDANGLRTRTCFAGREYVWDEVRFTPPIDVRVVAAAGTTWTIGIDAM